MEPDSLPLFVRHRYFVLVATGLLLLVAFLGLRDLWYPDEPDLGEVVQAMVLSGDAIVPLRNGEPWVDYPPLLYWASAGASWLLGGMSAFAFRLPSALAAIVLALVTCAATTRSYGPRAGLWAGLFLLTFTQFVYNAVALRPDMLFALWIGSGTFLYASGAGEGGKLTRRVGGFALLGLAVLTKGPLGLLLPGLVLTLWHLFQRRWGRLFELAPLGLVSVLVALPWYLACANAAGAEWLWNEIYAQNFQRFGSGIRYQGHIRPAYYYLVNVWADLAPWALLLPFAFVWTWRSGRWRRPEVQLALWWCFVWIGFLTMAATKRQLYLLPAYAPAALLLGSYVAALLRPREVEVAPAPWIGRIFTGGASLLLLGVGLAAVVGAFLIPAIVDRLSLRPIEVEVASSLFVPLLITGVVILGLGVWVGRAWLRGRTQAAFGPSVVAIVILWALLLGLVLPVLNPARTYAPQGLWIREQIETADVVGLHYPERGRNRIGGFALYARARVVLLDDPAAVREFLAVHPQSLVLLYDGASEAFFRAAGPDPGFRVVRDDLDCDQRRYQVLRRP